jgi:hypothetical protein
MLWAIAGSMALAALSAAVLPTVPSYDPWAWIVWGRELVDPHLAFSTAGGPSWKPLPVAFTAIFALFGSAAPTLWVISARAAGLLALIAAWRLAARLADRVTGGEPPARLIAGVVAVLGLALTQNFFYFMFRGTSEPMLCAATLWAIEKLLDRRHAGAFAAGLALALLRPEAWPFLGVYAIWLWTRQPQLRGLVAAGLLAIPLLWFVPPWIGSGQPLQAAGHARAYNGHLGSVPVLTALRRCVDLQILPVLIAAAVAVGWAGLRNRDRLVLALAAGALGWIAIVLAMVIDGYPGLERFFLPPTAILCVLAGVGFAAVAVLARGRVASAAVAAVLIGSSAPLASARLEAARAAKPAAAEAVRVLDQLTAAVSKAGGHAGVFPCRSSFAAVNHGVQTALAWKLRVTLGRVGTSMRKPGVDFVGPHNTVDGVAAPVDARLATRRTVARAGVWRVVRVTEPGRSDRCVGR